MPRNKRNKKFGQDYEPSNLIAKTEKFLENALEALNLLSVDDLKKLLKHNGQEYLEDGLKDQLLLRISEDMAFGFVEPCPRCRLKLKLGEQGYFCESEKLNRGRCRFKSSSPPHKPFLIPEQFHEATFFTEYSFVKLYRDFRSSDSHEQKPSDEPNFDSSGRQVKNNGYEKAVRDNELFKEYYKKQGIVSEEEFEEFIHMLREPLPSTFRVTGFGRCGKELQQAIENDYLNDIIGNIKVNDKEIEPPKSLPWYPDNMAWQLDTDRSSIRHIPALMKLKQFLINETNSGNISRQEAVSMIPPLVLDVQSHHKVLDMCAAPGSKTSQLIEFLHGDETKAVPDGIVVANDNDNKRCYLMCHQVKRLQTPCCLIVNHDASQLPGFRIDDELIKFDRVLADVPCTGDGTLRKNVDAWQKWNPAMGHNLHTIQSRILKRGIEVLETGGRLVYSTCSLNPIENEAVLASVLTEYGGDVEILDVTAELPGLKFLPGMKSWKVMSRSGDWYNNLSEVPDNLRTQIFKAMFPPSSEVVDKLHLERCMRVLPHLQNTGGFFITVLKKHEDAKDKRQAIRKQKAIERISSESNETASKKANDSPDEKDTDCDSTTSVKRRECAIDYDYPLPLKKQKLSGYKEDPFVFLENDDPVLDAIKLFYGLDGSFPSDQVLVRCTIGKKRNLYFVSHTVKKIVQNNEDKIKFINMGVKIFNRSQSKYCTACDYRLVQEGIEVLYPYVTKRKIKISSSDVVRLLTTENPFIAQFSQLAQDQLNDLDSEGSLIYIFDPDCTEFEKVDKPRCKLIITGWKGVISARTFLPVADRAHYLRLCGIEFKTKEQLEIEKSHAETAAMAETEESPKMIDEESDSISENQDLNSIDKIIEPSPEEQTNVSDDNVAMEDGNVLIDKQPGVQNDNDKETIETKTTQEL